MYDLALLIDCPICGRLYQRYTLKHKPTDKEIAELNKKVDEDHRKLHELNETQARFEKIDWKELEK